MRLRKVKGNRKTTCSKCNSEIEKNRLDSGQKYCKTCHAEHARSKRKKHSELSPEQKRKANCRAHTNTNIKRGRILREACYNCGDEKAEVHHSDYSKPLHVHWLCRVCHLLLHSDQELEERINSMACSKIQPPKNRKPKGECKGTCSKCNIDLGDRKGRYRYCLKCHSDTQRKYRERQSYTELEKRKTD